MGARSVTPGEARGRPHPPCPSQTLLWEAHEVELQRQREVEKLERQLALPPAEQAATQVSPHLPALPSSQSAPRLAPDTLPVH